MKNLESLLDKMTSDLKSNYKYIIDFFGTVFFIDDENQSLLHIFVDKFYNEEKCFLAIKTLLEYINPNYKNEFGYNFIQLALYTSGYSENFIINIIKESLKHGLDVNHVDDDKDTIMHTAIYSEDYHGKIINIYKLLCDNGFNSKCLCGEGRNLLEAIKFQDKLTKQEFYEFKKEYKIRIRKMKLNLEFEEIRLLERFGVILNLKEFQSAPAINRDDEVKALMLSLASNTKHPILVGSIGVGKSTLIEELVYRIQKNNVPDYLKNKIILHFNTNEINLTKEDINKFIMICEKNNIILFIDDIHLLYDQSLKNYNKNSLSVLKFYINSSEFMCENNLKIIGSTTNEKYNKYFNNNISKEIFDKIDVLKQNLPDIRKIIDKLITDGCLNYKKNLENFNLKSDIVNAISNLYVLGEEYRNPEIYVQIIEKAFLVSKFYNSEDIKIEHFIESISLNNNIDLSIKDFAILDLKNLKQPVEKNKKILKKIFSKRN